MSFDITTLPDLVQNQLYTWDENIRRPHRDDGSYPPRGLWVRGERGAGSTFVGRGAYIHAESIFDRPFGTERFASQVGALELAEMVRNRWTLDSGTRQNSYDQGLWEEAYAHRKRVDWLLSESPVTFVDNLYEDTYDEAFWRKNIWPFFDSKIKKGKAVVIASDMDVKDAIGSHWKNTYIGCPAVLPPSSVHAGR